MILVKLSSFSIAEYLINVNISHRIPSLIVITAVFVFIVERKFMFLPFLLTSSIWLLLDFISCCLDTVFSIQVYFYLAVAKASSLYSGPRIVLSID